MVCGLLSVPAGAAANAPNHDLERGPRILGAVPGGNPAASAGAWSQRGAVPPRLVGGRWRIVSNSVLLSPPIPARASGAAVAVRHRALAGRPVLDVSVDGGSRRATLEPARRERLSWVWLPPSTPAGRRLAFDPTAALGRSVDIGRLGPIAAPIPGWRVTRGAPRLTRLRGRRIIVARERVTLQSVRFATGPGAARIQVEARGSGALRIRAGGRAATRRVGASWRRLSLALPRGARRTRLRIDAIPGARDIQLRVVGRIVRRTGVRGLRRTNDGDVVGRIVPRGGGLAVQLRDVRGRPVARGRTSASGRFRLAGAPGRLSLVTPGDRERLRNSWAVR